MPVNIICLDGKSFVGRVIEVGAKGKCIIIKHPVEGRHKIYSSDIKEILVFGEYDPPLPPRNPNPTKEDKDRLRNLLLKYRKHAATHSKDTSLYDEELEKL